MADSDKVSCSINSVSRAMNFKEPQNFSNQRKKSQPNIAGLQKLAQASSAPENQALM